MAAEPLITRDDVSARISPVLLKRCLDDTGQGDADNAAVDVLLDDVSTWIRGKIGPIAELSTLSAETAGDLKRIACDVFRAYLCERHPEVMRQDASKIFERCAREIKMIRLGEASLGTEAPPEVLANNGGTVTSGDPDDPCPREQFALNGTGDF